MTYQSQGQENPSGFKLLSKLSGHKGVIYETFWSQDGKTIASCSEDKTIRLWDGLTGELLNILEGHDEWVRSISFSPDGLNLASASDDGTIRLWDIATGGHNIITIVDYPVRVVRWSPNGKFLASGFYYNPTIKLWNTTSWNLDAVLEGHKGSVLNLAWSPNSQNFVSVSDDRTVRLWDIRNRYLLKTFKGHSAWIGGVDFSPNSNLFASSSRDGSIKIYNSETLDFIGTIEGHTSDIKSVSFSHDGRFLVSNSRDYSVRIWDCTNWSLVALLKEECSSFRTRVTFHPNSNNLATLTNGDTVIRLWELDYNLLLKTDSGYSIFNYINAKVILLGESGVGKSGLGTRIAEKIFRETKSTHGAKFWQIPLPKDTFSASQLDGNINAELTLWDLAGQPDYHLIHQLFLDNIDIALLLFDCSDAANPFKGVSYWAKVLKKQAPEQALKYLISARCDVSPVTVDQKEINGKLAEHELNNYFCTSAFTGQGVDELLQHILNNIPWDKLPRTSTPKLFQIIREYLLEQKESGKSLLTLEEIRIEIIQHCDTGKVINDGEIETVINLLQSRGFVYFLEPTPNLSLVLLKPELINKYASSIIQAAREEGVGAILERDVVCANLSFAGFEDGERLPAAEEKLILESTVELFIRRNLGFREIGRLIFPSQLNIRQEIPADQHPPTEVTYEFSGSVEAIYASLVVCLSYTKDFQLEQLWKYAAEFSRDGHKLGFAMQQAEGTGELEIYFYKQVTDFDRVTFIRFIQDHLHKKGIDLKERIRLYCPECSEEVKNRKAIEKRVKEGKLQIPCQYCDASVLIPRSIEEKYRSDRAYIEKQQELQATIKERTRQVVIAFREDREQYMSETDKQIRILHLSDIHLGTSDQAKNYFTQLATDLTQNLKVKQINYLVLSGDIANYSTVEEYNAAFELVDKLVNRYGLNPDRVITVPGNHDLNWDLSEEAYDFIPKRKLPESLPEGQYIDAGGAGALIRDEERYQQRFKHFSDRFYKKVYSKPYPLEYDQQAILHPCPDDKILFLALNSCWELDHHYKDRASIKSEAISHAVEQILDKYDDWLKIAVWHHPVTSAESMKNVAFLEQLAVNGFQVAMHGHIHEAKNEFFKYDVNRGLNIIAAGTFGAPANQQLPGIPLQYNLLVLNPDNGELTVETRKKEKVDGAWSADARWGDKNNPVPRYVIPLNYGDGKKKSEETNQSQPNKKSEGNPSSNPPNTTQSILSNVNVGGNLTIGNINQTSSSGAISPPNPSNINIDNRTINIGQGNYNENIGRDYIQGERGEDTGKKQN
ncbi:MAG: metallophosphoesterase [Cyanobacteria bacterium J06621_8]